MEFKYFITLKIEQAPSSGMYFLTSPDERGLLLCDPDLGALLNEVPHALVLLKRAAGEV